MTIQEAIRIGGAAIRRGIRAWARPAGGVAILAVLLAKVGAGPFVEGLRLTTAGALAAAAGITVLTTLCCAWRWSLVAGGMGVEVPLRQAVGAYYRSSFLNATLPGGVLGDVHRGLRHGKAVGDQGRALRSVAWERGSGQTVQTALTLAVLLVAWPGMSAHLAAAIVVLLIGLAVLALVVVTLGAMDERRRAARIARAITTDLRGAVLTRRTGPFIVLASVLALLGYVAVFAVALHVTGMDLPAGKALPLALVVLLAAALPLNIAGWGPREGAAAWAFGVVGLSAAEGVTVAVVYGVLALVATLPGAVLLAADWRRSQARAGGVVHA